jgi:hypothetical protein
MHCTLLVTDAWYPLDMAERGIPLPALHALQTLLARGRRQRGDAATAESRLCDAFGVARQSDYPIAALTLAFDGGNPGAACWLRADPVHLQAQRNRLVLVDSGAFEIATDEARQLTDALNRQFAADGMLFHPLRPDRWYLRLEAAPQLVTTPLPAAAGRDIDALLPQGADALRWHARINEAQMVLSDHPVNEAREARGELPVNSIWPWGGGGAPHAPQRPFTHVWSDDVTARALAHATEIPHEALPPSGAQWLEHAAPDGHHLIVNDHLRGAAQYADHGSWLNAATALDSEWLAPLLDALRHRRLSELVLWLPGIAFSYSCTITPADLWKIWRRARPLTDYAPR